MRLARQSLDLSQNATAGNSVLLTFSSTQSNGGLGQLAVGTFQLRAVPEPSTSAYLTGILSLAALLACRRKRHIALVTNPSQRALGRRERHSVLFQPNLGSVLRFSGSLFLRIPRRLLVRWIAQSQTRGVARCACLTAQFIRLWVDR